MGQIVLAAGTSVPDAIASIVVAKLGKGDMAVRNGGRGERGATLLSVA